jgi:hypothetical protein
VSRSRVASLQADIEKYDSFGEHRLGSRGADDALDWIAAELEAAGLDVTTQDFSVDRQYNFDRGALAYKSLSIPVVPHWWPPEDSAIFERTALIVTDNRANDEFLLLELPYDQGAYLSAAQKDAITRASACKPAAILLCIRHPSHEIFTYNVSQDDPCWPQPVILVPEKHISFLQSLAAMESMVSVRIRGEWQRDLPARNIIGRTPSRGGKPIVISTPVTSWFTSTGERAPGIACFLALARRAVSRWKGHGITFVATSGHEVGHGGMEHFIAHEAPSPGDTHAWVHLGASLACHFCASFDGEWRAHEAPEPQKRFFLGSDALADVVARQFSPLGGTLVTGAPAAIGELRDVYKAGHQRFAGMVGLQQLFHTPADRAFVTSGAILAPVLGAFEAMIDEIDSQAG